MGPRSFSSPYHTPKLQSSTLAERKAAEERRGYETDSESESESSEEEGAVAPAPSTPSLTQQLASSTPVALARRLLSPVDTSSLMAPNVPSSAGPSGSPDAFSSSDEDDLLPRHTPAELEAREAMRATADDVSSLRRVPGNSRSFHTRKRSVEIPKSPSIGPTTLPILSLVRSSSTLTTLGRCDLPLEPRLNKAFRVVRGLAEGDTSATTERHVSLLMRQWEVQLVADCKARHRHIMPLPGCKFKEEPVKNGPALLGAGGAVLFLAMYFTLVLCTPVPRIDSALIALYFAVLVLYFVIFWQTGWGLYRSWSAVDGFNTVTRFTFKLGLARGNTTFPRSNMPSSISSSVSTRGSSLNKLMISVSWILGMGLCLKFLLLNEEVASWETVMGIAYLSIIYTGMYENRTFDLDSALETLVDVDGRPVCRTRTGIKHHRYGFKELRGQRKAVKKQSSGESNGSNGLAAAVQGQDPDSAATTPSPMSSASPIDADARPRSCSLNDCASSPMSPSPSTAMLLHPTNGYTSSGDGAPGTWRNSELPMTVVDQTTSETYEVYHCVGVFSYLGITLFAHSMQLFRVTGYDNASSLQRASWWCSFCALFVGFTFIWLNCALCYAPESKTPLVSPDDAPRVQDDGFVSMHDAREFRKKHKRDFRHAHTLNTKPSFCRRAIQHILYPRCLQRVFTPAQNFRLGLLCISVELSALLLATAGGMLYQPVHRSKLFN